VGKGNWKMEVVNREGEVEKRIQKMEGERGEG
jgi:hypothetical protein